MEVRMLHMKRNSPVTAGVNKGNVSNQKFHLLTVMIKILREISNICTFINNNERCYNKIKLSICRVLEGCYEHPILEITWLLKCSLPYLTTDFINSLCFH